MKKEPYMPPRGMPDYELWMPDNPFLSSGELFKFSHLYDESIGYDCRGVNDQQPFLVKLLLQMDIAHDKAVGFNNVRSFPSQQMAIEVTDESRIIAYRRNKRDRAKHGRRIHSPMRCMDPDEELIYHGGLCACELTLLDRLALGDTRAGHELYQSEP